MVPVVIPVRRRLPLLPTVMVAIAVPVLMGFGFWQVQRAAWKDALLADLARNAAAPMVIVGPGVLPEGLDFRRVRLTLACRSAAPQPRAGRNREGQSGYSVVFSCSGHGADIALNAGWGPRADSWAGAAGFPPAGAFGVEGVLVRMPDAADADWTLVADQAPAPLVPSAPPSVATIPDNHRSYAVQWFGFAGILAVIYGLWLRGWLATRRDAA